MYQHILFFGYMGSAFPALPAFLFIVVVQRKNEKKKDCTEKHKALSSCPF